MSTIRKRGTRWQAQVRIKQEGEIVFQESATFDTKRQAQVWADALEERIARVGFQAHQQGSTSLTSLLMEYVKFKEGFKPLSRGMQHSIRALLAAPFAEKSLSQLAAPEIVRWAGDIGQNLDPSTVLHHLMVLRSAYAHAPSIVGFKPDDTALTLALDTLKRNKVIAKSKQRDRRVSDDELQQIVRALNGRFNVLVPADIFVQLAVLLPRRREELLTMRWEDYTGTTIKLRDTKNPRTPRDEVVPVPPAARVLIDSLPQIDERILPYRPESVSAAFQRTVRALGLEDIRLHDLRHEGISRLFEQGLSIQEVALISGHVSWTALRRYTHIKPINVVEKLNASRQRTQKVTA